jgi:hypothetical protein
VDRNDSTLQGILRRTKLYLGTIDKDGSSRGLHGPCKQLHQRALPGAVLADEGVNASAIKRGGDIVES